MIEQAKYSDLEEIMRIIKKAIEEMREDKNPQWGSTEENYPNEEQFIKDIEKKRLYLYKEENEIRGFITITVDNHEYEDLIKTSSEKSYILHRMCIPKKFRKQSIASKLMLFAEKLGKENDISVLKADTEISNTKMNHLFLKMGYVLKGTFIYEDYPGTYNYYEKNIK